MENTANERQLRYLKGLHYANLVIVAFYSLKYNLDYEKYYLNYFIVPLFFLNLMPLLIWHYFKNYFWSALMTVLAPSLSLTLFLLTAGGLNAPGVFWPTALPMVTGLLLGVRGIKIGASLTFCTYIILFISEKNPFFINVIESEAVFQIERKINLTLFSLYCLFITWIFVSTEEKIRSTLEKQKRISENLLRIIIHDISSPLSVINLSLERLSRKPDSMQIKKTQSTIEKQTENMLQILEKVKEIRAIADGKTEFRMTETCVNDIISETIELMKPLAAQKNIQIKCQPAIKEKIYIYSDSLILKNVILANVINNSIKFSNTNSDVEVYCKAEKHSISLSVKDFGIGIPKSLLSDLFSLNKVTSRPGTSGEKGTGYGLLLVKEWVERFHGTLKVISHTKEDAPDHSSGTVITMTFPIAK